MNARVRARVDVLWEILRKGGLPGERYGEGEVARALGVARTTVVAWIERGWLTASRLRISQGKGWYRIRRRALRRAIIEHPEVARTVLRAADREDGERESGNAE
jgi:excisionase family DNA binding protein